MERFANAAREVDADMSENALDRAIGKLDLKKKPPEPEKKGPKDG
jgi:hypothetical protein